MDDMPPLLAFGADRAGIALRALRPVPALTLHAYIRGIVVGRLELPEGLAAGAERALPIARIPCIEPPFEIRIAAARDGALLAPPWTVARRADAAALVGPGAPEVSGLRLEAGVLRGVLLDQVNGLAEPVLFARINAAVVRGVGLDPPLPLPEGGAAWRFALVLEPGDLTETGLGVALFGLGGVAPLAQWAWTRAATDDPGPRIAAVAARLAQHEAAREAGLARLAAELDARMQRQEARIEAFITAAATLLFDRVAGPVGRMPATDPAIAALHALVAAAGAPAVEPATTLTLGAKIVAGADADAFALGWLPPEADGRERFRWMGARAVLMSPAPERPLAAVTLRIAHLFGAPAPGLGVAFDGAVGLVAVRPEGAGWVAVLRPAQGPVPVAAIRLDCGHAGSPSDGGASTDRRVLSVAVAEIAFEFAD